MLLPPTASASGRHRAVRPPRNPSPRFHPPPLPWRPDPHPQKLGKAKKANARLKERIVELEARVKASPPHRHHRDRQSASVRWLAARQKWWSMRPYAIAVAPAMRDSPCSVRSAPASTRNSVCRRPPVLLQVPRSIRERSDGPSVCQRDCYRPQRSVPRLHRHGYLPGPPLRNTD